MSYARNLARLARAGALIVDNLQAIRDLTIYDTLYPLGVIARGHTTPGDGGGGYFNITTGQTPGYYTDDNGITVEFTGGDGSAAAVRDFDGSIFVAWFSTVTEALTAAEALNKDLVFPPGEYDLSNWATYTANASLKLRGSGATLTGPDLSTDFIHSESGDIHVTGITFTQWRYPIQFSATANVGEVYLDQCRDDNSIQFVNGATGGSIEKFTALNCTIDHSAVDPATSTKGFGIWSVVLDGHVENCSLHTIRGTGIRIGNDAEDATGHISVIGNTITDIHEPDTESKTSNGIDVRGTNCTITGNKISRVTSATEHDAEAIYVKIVSGTISANAILDGGQEEGAIAVKGVYREETVPPTRYSYGIVVSGNSVVFTDDPRFENSVGIFVATSDVLVTGNHVLNAGTYGINTDNNAPGTVNSRNNIMISGNQVVGCRGSTAIYINNSADELVVKDNVVEWMPNLSEYAADVMRPIWVRQIGEVTGTSKRLVLSGNSVSVGNENTTTASYLSCIAVNINFDCREIEIAGNSTYVEEGTGANIASWRAIQVSTTAGADINSLRICNNLTFGATNQHKAINIDGMNTIPNNVHLDYISADNKRVFGHYDTVLANYRWKWLDMAAAGVVWDESTGLGSIP